MAAWAQILSMVGSKALDWGLDHYENVRQQHFEHDEAALQRDWESDEALASRQWQENMWNKENAYNTPSAQMQRYEEAGINPYLSQGAVSSAGSSQVPSASVPSGAKASAPVMQSSHRFGDLGDFILNQSQVSASNSNQRAQAFKTSVEAASELWKLSPKLAKEFLSRAAEQYGQDSESFGMMSQQWELDMKAKDLSNDRQVLENALVKEYGAKKAQADLDQIDQFITESVARIGKMASDAEVNDAKISEIGASIAEKMAAAGLMSAQAGQIVALLPYIEKSLAFDVGKGAMSYLTEYSDFEQNEYVRDWQKTDKAKSTRLRTNSMSKANNIVGAFMDGFVSKIPSGTVPSMINNSGFYRTSSGYRFGNAW